MQTSKQSFSFIFPGQGSQKIGMGKNLYQEYREAKDVFDLIDDTLNRKLSEIIFFGTNEELTKTSNNQPALMAVSIALVKVIEKEANIKFSDLASIVCGHSLGEYSALCSINSINIANTARLLETRGKAMQESVAGEKTKMTAVIGLNIEDVENILEENKSDRVCQIANDNCPGQIVLSGHSDQIDKISKICKQNGAKITIDLNVSAPFHCSLMKNVSNTIQLALKDVNVSDADTKFINNYNACFEKNSENIKKLLVKQVVNRVRWRETINLVANSEVNKIFEIGSGKVLSGLNRRMGINLETENISCSDDINHFLKTYC